MTNLEVFNQQEVLGKDFKIYGTKDSPMFLAKDVANWIEHNKPGEMIRNVDEEEKIKLIINPGDSIAKVLQSNTEYWFLTEDGLYEVLMQSRKPIAKEFKKEVKHILKNIRKHGAHMTDNKIEELITNPDLVIQLATALKEERKKLDDANLLIEEQKPKVEFVDDYVDTEGLQNHGQVAKTLGLGRNKMLEELRENGVLMKNNVPYQRYMNLGWFELKQYMKGKYSGVSTLYTPKGVLGIERLLIKRV